MSIKRKLILMGICVGIVLIVLSVNIIHEIQNGNQEGSEANEVSDNVMTRAEAFRLFSYLEYNKTEREALPFEIKYENEKMSGWYDTFANAACNMGLIGSNIKQNPTEKLTYGECKIMVDKLILANPTYQKAYENLTFDFTKAEEDMLTADFLELYQGLMNSLPKEELKVKEDTLLVLGREVTDDSKDRMVTDKGKYYYLNARRYEKYIKLEDTSSTNVSVTPSPIPKSDKKDNLKEKEKNLTEEYKDKGIKVLICDQEILYITAVATDKIVVHNVWIKQGKENQIDTFINGIDKSFQAASPIKTPIEKVIGDITVENQKIVKINVKPDMIHGKVLSTGKDFIEIAGYGKVPLEEDYKIYKIFGDLTVEPTGSILVGYENTDFVVSNGKISAALITGSIKADNIRVLLKTTGFKDIYHNKIVLTATTDFTVSTKKSSKSYKAGEKVTIKPSSKLLEEGRITVKPSSNSGKIQLLSMKRSYGNPKYRGNIEIAKDSKKLIVINELPMEEYLYAVIPSEMPTRFGVEALKVQAVCARSYAYRHLMANSLSKYGAHVDDSVSYQVYNNVAENEDSILAVKDTYGQVLKYDNDVIVAYYFSTSCGHTASPTSVWNSSSDLPYLDGKLMLDEAQGDNSESQNNAEKLYEDLSSEKTFQKFITAKDFTTYDSQFSWYRWKVTMDVNDIEKVINNNLAARYNAHPELILKQTSKAKAGKKAEFKSVPVNTVGNLVDISVLKRDTSGIVSEILIKGSKNTIKVSTDYNIRTLLAPVNSSVVLQDKSEVNSMSLLPSAFFRIDEKKKSGKLSKLTLTGGGFGHGVGMSQNAVKSLTAEGKSYKDIVAYFYKGTELGNIYN